MGDLMAIGGRRSRGLRLRTSTAGVFQAGRVTAFTVRRRCCLQSLIKSLGAKTRAPSPRLSPACSATRSQLSERPRYECAEEHWPHGLPLRPYPRAGRCRTDQDRRAFWPSTEGCSFSKTSTPARSPRSRPDSASHSRIVTARITLAAGTGSTGHAAFTSCSTETTSANWTTFDAFAAPSLRGHDCLKQNARNERRHFMSTINLRGIGGAWPKDSQISDNLAWTNNDTASSC
jgi:hypothetical protein